MDYEIKDFKAVDLNRGLLMSDYQPAHTANIVFANGDWIGVSRYHDEVAWVADCAFRANGYPVFSNGTGSRCTAAQVLTDETIIADLDSRR
jgi:hypothetical protein